MPIAQTGWKTSDGKWFDQELPATRHEAIEEIKKRFPDLRDRIQIIEIHAVELAQILVPLATAAGKPPLPSPETTLETPLETTLDLLGNPVPEITTRLAIWRDPAAPQDNVPKDWRYFRTIRDADDALVDTYQHKNGGMIDIPRSGQHWTRDMIGGGQPTARFGDAALNGCAHEWEIDTPCRFVDTCKHCGLERA